MTTFRPCRLAALLLAVAAVASCSGDGASTAPVASSPIGDAVATTVLADPDPGTPSARDTSAPSTEAENEPESESSAVQAVFELVTDREVVDALTQYERVGLRIRVTGIDETADDIQVRTTSEFVGGGLIRTDSDNRRYELDDVAATGLIHLIGAYPIALPGTYDLTITGVVTVDDDEYPIDETLSFEVEEVPVEIEVSSLNGGTFEVQLPTSWEVAEDRPFEVRVVDDLGETSDFMELSQRVVSLRAIDGSGSLGILRSRRPQAVPSLDAAANSVRAMFDPVELGESVNIEFNGSPGVRLAATIDADVDYVADIVGLDGEFILIEQRADSGSPTVEIVRAIRDSLVIDSSAFPA